MDLENHHQQQQQQYQNQQPNSGLLRFRSAPSSLFANSCDNLDPERLFSRFMSSTTNDSDSLNFQDFEEKSVAAAAAGGVGVGQRSCGNEYSLMNCRSELPPQYPRQSSATATSPIGMDGSYGVVNSMRTATAANLVRQNSSPPGLFSQLNVQNGYAAMRGVGNFRVGNHSEVSPSASRLGLLSQISEIGNESAGGDSPEDIKHRNHDTRFYGSGFPGSSWTDSVQFMEDDEKLFSGTQNGDQRNRARVLSHSLSLPKTSVEMAAMEKLMQFQDSVPCKIRAKRGCATHPRSIAERVRRTRISERMRKLQELVPNMDKQTNTADMLDLAVDYIKDLQRQFKTLSDNRAKCKCSSTKRSMPNQTV